MSKHHRFIFKLRKKLRKKFQVINAWLYKGCWMEIITAENPSVINEEPNEHFALAIRKTISKFIECGVLHHGVSTSSILFFKS